MKKETTKEELHDYYNASYYFSRALQHYLEFQEEYRQMLPMEQRPENPNMLTVNLVNQLANHLAEEEISFDGILRESISHAKFGRNMTDMVGIFSCKACGEKGIIPIEVKTNRDHIQLLKNGQFDFKAHKEYENTEEVISLNFMIPENFAPGCTCNGKITEMNEWLLGKTHLGISLSDENVRDLKALSEKKKRRNNNRIEL